MKAEIALIPQPLLNKLGGPSRVPFPVPRSCQNLINLGDYTSTVHSTHPKPSWNVIGRDHHNSPVVIRSPNHDETPQTPEMPISKRICIFNISKAPFPFPSFNFYFSAPCVWFGRESWPPEQYRARIMLVSLRRLIVAQA